MPPRTMLSEDSSASLLCSAEIQSTLDSTTRIRISDAADVQADQPVRQPHHAVAVVGFRPSSSQSSRFRAPVAGRGRSQLLNCRFNRSRHRFHRRTNNPPLAAVERISATAVERRKRDRHAARCMDAYAGATPARSAAAAPAAAQVGADRRRRRAAGSAAPAAAPPPRAAPTAGIASAPSTSAGGVAAPPRRRGRPRSAPPPAARRPRRAPGSARARRAAASSPARSSWPSGWNGHLDQLGAELGPGLAPRRIGLRVVAEPERRPRAAVRPRLPSRGSDSAPLTTTRTGLRVVDPEVAHVEPRVVAAHRAGADQHRVGLGAHQVHLGARPRAGDPAALAGAGGDPPVERGGELQRQHRPPGGSRLRKPRFSATASAARQPTSTAMPAAAQRLDAARRRRAGRGPRSRPPPAPPRPRPAPSAQGGVAAGVGAGLERDVGGGAARAARRPRASATVSACGRPPSPVRPRPTTRPLVHEDAADRRVRPDPPEPAPRQPERRAHPARVPVVLGHRAQSSSRPAAAGRSSETKSSKSSAAWKFL